jgi:RNA polymerase primary sigma factor
MGRIDYDVHLLESAREGDRGARERLVAAYLAAVRSIALRYRDLGVPVDDLVQEGSLGLLEAIDRYDPRRGADFESYARFRIRRAIRNALTDQSRLIRLPKQIVERRRAIDRAEAALKGASGRAPSPAEVAAVTGLSAAAIAATRCVGTPPVSLDQPALEDGSPLETIVADGAARDPVDETVEHEEAREVDDAVSALPTRQRELVSRHFGLGRDAQELAEVAQVLHVSQQRARAIERDALYALRERLEPAPTRRSTR